MAKGVTIDFTANVAKFEKQIDKIGNDLNKFQNKVTSVSKSTTNIFKGFGVGLAAAGFANFVKSGIDTADMLSKLSDKTGVAVENLAGLKLAADLSDTSLEAAGRAINKLSIFMGENADAAKQLGLSAQDPIEAFLQFADVFKSVQDAQDRAALGNKVLGRSYAELSPLLLQGSGALREQISAGRDYLPVSTEMAKQAADFNDNLTKLTSSLQKYSIEIGGPIVENINSFIRTIQFAQKEIANLGGGISGAINFAFNGSQLTQVTKDIEQTQKKILAMQANGSIGGLIDDLVGNDINKEKNRLDSLLKKRETLLQQFKRDQAEQNKKASITPVDLSGVNNVLNRGGSTSKKADSQSQRISALQREASQLFLNTRDPLEKLDIEIDKYLTLLGKGAISTDTYNRAVLSSITAYEQAEGSVQAYNDQLSEGARLTESLRTPLEQLDDSLSNYRELLEAGAISLETYNRAALNVIDNLGFLGDETKQKLEELSPFAEQAARNMQDAFADFLFDPFKDGLGGMVRGFADAIRRMVAEKAAAQLFDGLGFDKLFDSGIKGIGSAISSFIPGFATGGDFGGGLRIVGENGPELEYTGPSKIFSNKETKDILGNAKQSISVVNQFTIAQPASRQSQEQVAAAAGRGIQRALARTR